MRQEDRKEFAKMMAGLGELFDKQVTKTLVEIYWQALRPYPFEEVKKAMEMAVLKCKFYPKPAELIEFICGGEAEMAWGALLNAMREYGVYTSVTFEDGRIAKCVELMGGWQEVAGWKTEELKYRMKDFIQLYRSLPSMPPKKVVGLIELENGAKGIPVSDDKVLYPTAFVPRHRVEQSVLNGKREGKGEVPLVEVAVCRR